MSKLQRALTCSVIATDKVRAIELDRNIRAMEIRATYPGKERIDEKHRLMAALLEFGTVGERFANRELHILQHFCGNRQIIWDMGALAQELIDEGLPVCCRKIPGVGLVVERTDL